MKLNLINTIFATVVAALLVWWLWSMGNDSLQQSLLAVGGGLFLVTGLVGGMGVKYKYNRSGAQMRIVLIGMAAIAFIACVVYSFFDFTAISFCIPMGVFFILGLLLAYQIYTSEM